MTWQKLFENPMDEPFRDSVSSKYGAPMGRRSSPLSDFVGKVHLRRVPMVDYDYDPGGAYWGGGGETLYAAWDDNGAVVYLRAKSRADAKSKLPGLSFYR